MMHCKKTIAAIISLLLLFPVAANAGTFEDGVFAYEHKDYVTAAKMFRLVARRGDSHAQFNLGLMYDLGLGVNRDYKEAVKWYRFSADQGYTKSQLHLGLMYAYGKGVFRDYSRAHMWFSNAASFSQDYAEQSRYNLEKKMSRVDIGKAQKMRWRCRTSNYNNC